MLLLSIYKIAESFAQNMAYGIIFNSHINIWLYRAIWIVAVLVFSYSLIKSYKDKKRFGIK